MASPEDNENPATGNHSEITIYFMAEFPIWQYFFRQNTLTINLLGCS
jgi:hypothetical protein